MNVASLELCRQLYELSDRKWDEDNWQDLPDGDSVPLYSLGYLLGKLPASSGGCPLTMYKNDHSYEFGYSEYGDITGYHGSGPSPEDAAAKLAIELFKQGILEKNA